MNKKNRGKDRDLLKNAYYQLAINIYADHIKNNHKIYAVCGCNSGVGTTAVATNLAKILARSGWNTVFINTDFHLTGKNQELPEVKADRGIAEYVLDTAGIESFIVKTYIKNLDYIGCGNVADKNAVEILCSKRFGSITKQLIPKYDFVIIDTYPILEGSDSRMICSEADAVILVVAIEETAKDDLGKAKKILEESDAEILGIVPTKVKAVDIIRRSR